MKKNKQYNTDGIYSQLYHLIEILLEKHMHTFRTSKSTPHQHDIFPYGCYGSYHHSFHNFLQK